MKAGLVSHNLGLAHTHVRLNSSQLHNGIRQRLGLADPPADPSRRRVLLGAINAALDEVTPEAVNFGTLMAEQASAARLMMTVAQMVKHIDAASPVRFLIAETETGYTLLSALYFAKLFGIEDKIEISPLFETAEALSQGGRIIEEALRSPHYRAYLRRTGKLCVQFGYSDSGRYVGQIAATYLIERLRLKLCEAMVKHGLKDVEIVLFDTHGESIGRGAHPGSLQDRLAYLSPAVGRRAFNAAGIAYREESAFQGGDGYLLFGTPALAASVILGIAKFALTETEEGDDPIYQDPDFAADFFATIRSSMEELVEDPGYAAMLGTFGPALIDRTGSRPAARQSDSSGGPAIIGHPRELRAIPNNAILQQLGWCANTLQGVGLAASRNPDAVSELRRTSPRFRRAMDFASHALRHSHLDVLRAVVETLDPGTWLDRAGHSRIPGRREALTAVATGLEQLGIWSEVLAMFRRVHADHLALRAAWPDAPTMPERELLLHALRLACIHRIWILTAMIPDFAPRLGVMRTGLQQRLLRLDVPAALWPRSAASSRARPTTVRGPISASPAPHPMCWATVGSMPRSSRRSVATLRWCGRSAPPSATKSAPSDDLALGVAGAGGQLDHQPVQRIVDHDLAAEPRGLLQAEGEVEHVLLILGRRRELVEPRRVDHDMAGRAGQGPLAGTLQVDAMLMRDLQHREA